MSFRRWIPNCGLRLTLNMKPTKSPELLFANFDSKELPEVVEPCKKLSNEDFLDNVNIYTEFGDLSPTQVLTLFCQFIKYPEYQESSFESSLESVLIKLHTHPEEADELELTEEDDEKAKPSETSQTK